MRAKKWIGRKGSFRQNALIMSSGAMLNVIGSLILTPIVTRLYDKSEFGIFYIFMSITAISAMVITGMYPQALVVPKFKEDFLALLKWSLILVGLGMILVTLGTFLFGASLLQSLGAPDLISYRFWIPLGVLITSMNMILLQWNVRYKEFKRNASANLAGGVGVKGAQIGLAATALGAKFPSLIYAKLVTEGLRSGFLLSGKMVREAPLLLRVSWEKARKQGREFLRYPKYVLSGNFVNRFTGDLPLYALTSFYGMSEVGAFGFAINILNIPYTVMGSSIAPVYFQRANELYHVNLEKLQNFTLESYRKLLLLGCLSFGFVFGFGDLLFGLVFSESWQLAGDLARILSIYFVFRIISSPFSTVFRVVRKEHYGLLINVIIAVSRMIGLGVGLYIGDLMLAVLGYSIGNVIGYGSTNIMIFRSVKLPILRHVFYTTAMVVTIFGAFHILRLVFDSIVLNG